MAPVRGRRAARSGVAGQRGRTPDRPEPRPYRGRVAVPAERATVPRRIGLRSGSLDGFRAGFAWSAPVRMPEPAAVLARRPIGRRGVDPRGFRSARGNPSQPERQPARVIAGGSAGSATGRGSAARAACRRRASTATDDTSSAAKWSNTRRSYSDSSSPASGSSRPSAGRAGPRPAMPGVFVRARCSNRSSRTWNGGRTARAGRSSGGGAAVIAVPPPWLGPRRRRGPGPPGDGARRSSRGVDRPAWAVGTPRSVDPRACRCWPGIGPRCRAGAARRRRPGRSVRRARHGRCGRSRGARSTRRHGARRPARRRVRRARVRGGASRRSPGRARTAGHAKSSRYRPTGCCWWTAAGSMKRAPRSAVTVARRSARVRAVTGSPRGSAPRRGGRGARSPTAARRRRSAAGSGPPPCRPRSG